MFGKVDTEVEQGLAGAFQIHYAASRMSQLQKSFSAATQLPNVFQIVKCRERKWIGVLGQGGASTSGHLMRSRRPRAGLIAAAGVPPPRR